MGHASFMPFDIDTTIYGKFMVSKKVAMKDAERLGRKLSIDIIDGARAIMAKYGEPDTKGELK